MPRILTEHFLRLQDRMLRYAEHTGLLAEHGDVLGAAREGFVRIFLNETLPSAVDYKTGQILDSRDNRSRQIDLVLQSVNSPRLTLSDDIQIALPDCLVGALEVKSDLTTAGWGETSHLRAALQVSQSVKQLIWLRKIGAEINKNPIELPRIPFFVVAYKGPTKETLADRLQGFGQHFGIPLDQYGPDLVVGRVLTR